MTSRDRRTNRRSVSLDAPETISAPYSMAKVPLGVVFRAWGQETADHLGAPSPQVPGCHQAVGAVVARSHQHDDPLARRATKLIAGGLRNGQPGVLHQRVGADARPLRRLLNGHHLRRGYDFHGDGCESSSGRFPRTASATIGGRVHTSKASSSFQNALPRLLP